MTYATSCSLWPASDARAGLGVNYAALGLVIGLLDRVAALERELRVTPPRRTGGRSWI